MNKEAPHVGGMGPIVVGVLPKQPRRVVLEARTLGEALGAPLVFAYVEINSYLVEWELKEDIRGNSLHPRDIDEDMTEEARDVLRILDSAMAGTKIEWWLRVLAGDPGKALARLGNDLHARMIVVGTRHKGVGARVSELLNGTTAHHVIAHQQLPVVVVPVHHEAS
ncbi:universal stress protein [Paeniglutamicibacter sp. ORCA_105]|uniref:universal stress protein n=1 Tax=Paeniglutamicibacter sp. ORCA_105 TaxID=3377336 RepID=UPI003896110B